MALVGSRHWQVILSDELLVEFRRNGTGKFKASTDDVEAFLSPVLEWGLIVGPVAVPPDACRDPSDLVILGTAVAGGADLPVTGDNDLLVLGSFENIAIISPRQLHDRFMAA